VSIGYIIMSSLRVMGSEMLVIWMVFSVFLSLGIRWFRVSLVVMVVRIYIGSLWLRVDS